MSDKRKPINLIKHGIVSDKRKPINLIKHEIDENDHRIERPVNSSSEEKYPKGYTHPMREKSPKGTHNGEDAIPFAGDKVKSKINLEKGPEYKNRINIEKEPEYKNKSYNKFKIFREDEIFDKNNPFIKRNKRVIHRGLLAAVSLILCFVSVKISSNSYMVLYVCF